MDAMRWLLEDPLPTVWVSAAAIVAFAVAWYRTGSRACCLGLCGAAVAAIGLVLLERYVVTDREAVESTIHAAAKAVEDHDLPRVLSFISTTAPAIRSRARGQMARVRGLKVDVKDNLQVDVHRQTTPPIARATFNVVVDGAGVRYPTFLEVWLRQENGLWRIYDYRDHGFLEGLKLEGRRQVPIPWLQ